MDVDAIIPTLNAEATLPELLRSIPLPPERILVADSSSEDRTLTVAREFGCRILEIRRKNFDHGFTRNLAYIR